MYYLLEFSEVSLDIFCRTNLLASMLSLVLVIRSKRVSLCWFILELCVKDRDRLQPTSKIEARSVLQRRCLCLKQCFAFTVYSLFFENNLDKYRKDTLRTSTRFYPLPFAGPIALCIHSPQIARSLFDTVPKSHLLIEIFPSYTISMGGLLIRGIL